MRGPIERHCRISVAGLGLAILLATGPVHAESLGDALDEHGIPIADLPLGHSRDRPITGYAVLSEPARFVIAYYEVDGSGGLEPPLYVLRFDNPSGRWRGATIDEAMLGPGNGHCFGPAVAARATRDAILVTTHVTPSASCTLLLSQGILLQTTLDGWVLGSYSDGTLVYHVSQVHFAPTHSAELSLYDPRTGRSRRIYPLMPYQSVRSAQIEMHRAVYDDPEWCKRQNHHCDPESFDNEIFGEIAVSDATDALAFIAAFGNDELAAPGQIAESPTLVLYVYRNVREPDRIEYREFLLDNFRGEFGELSLADALSPQMLDRLFAD